MNFMASWEEKLGLVSSSWLGPTLSHPFLSMDGVRQAGQGMGSPERLQRGRSSLRQHEKYLPAGISSSWGSISHLSPAATRLVHRGTTLKDEKQVANLDTAHLDVLEW